jgi:hypothetical protein
MSTKKIVSLSFLIILIIVTLISLGRIIETVEKGTYQIKQAAVTGTMSAKMDPGLWMQWFGDIDTWPKAWTFFFTHDEDTKDDVKEDTSIEVRFNDGSVCNISGTLRIIMPITGDDAIKLVTVRGHKTMRDLEEKLIKPTVRRVLRSTANLMTARESYNEKRLDFITWARDQIENGVYLTEETRREVEDLVTGEKVWKAVKKIRTGKDGNPLHQSNPMQGTNIELKNFEIKQFVYEDVVKDQIATQQKARMAVETAKAKAEEARQDELKAVAEGKKNVAISKYEKEQTKVQAIVEAEKAKAVKILDGERELEFAKLQRAAATENKAKNILDGQGLAEKRRLVIEADGALKQKLTAWLQAQQYWASAYSNRKVPAYYMAGGGNGESQTGNLDVETQQFMKMLNIMTAQSLGLNLNIKKGGQP